MKKIFCLIIVTFFCLSFTLYNSSNLKFIILNNLKLYTTDNYPEKIYIQTDKPYYMAGENIWFNTYLVNGVTHTNTLKSKIIYVELIDEQDKIISEQKLFTEEISVPGDFKLPLELKEGPYLLRAYTNYMRNQSKDFFFKKEIPIFAINPELQKNKTDSIITDNSELPDIGFYPEGGYLVNGINNKVAIKIKDADVTSNPIIGIIEDNLGNKITDFNTMEFGLGSFFLKPDAGKVYRAVILSGDENIQYNLPNPLSHGYVMNTKISEKEILINVTTNNKEGLKNTLIIGQQRGLAAFDYTEEKNTNSLLIRIPKEELLEGILNIVMFNNSEKPVAERMVYISKKQSINLAVKIKNSAAIKLRERVNLEIEVKDNSGKLVPSTFSLSVIDSELITLNKNAENIKTSLLLNSDLRGNIKSPNYFFTTGDSIKKHEQLDLIMLTHGWTRFTWQELLQNKLRNEHKPEDGLYISGNTLNAKSPFQNKESETKLTFRKNGLYQENIKTDKNGYFSYGPFTFKDTINVFLQAGKALSSKNSNYSDTNIVLNKQPEKPGYISERTKNSFTQQNPNVDFEIYKKKTRNNIFKNFKFDRERELLAEVQLKGKIKTKEEIKNIERKKRSRSFNPSHRIIVDDLRLIGGGDFIDLISNIAGVFVGSSSGGSSDPEVSLRGLKPSFYIDNVEVNLSTARSINQAHIDFIDVLHSGAASAQYGLKATGVIAIYTKRGSRNIINITDKKLGSINFKMAGFYDAREFYAPNYSKVDRNIARGDYRSTLYWNPKIISNGFQNPITSFYTSDERGRFQIIIEGITDSGTPFFSTSFLEVE